MVIRNGVEEVEAEDLGNGTTPDAGEETLLPVLELPEGMEDNNE